MYEDSEKNNYWETDEKDPIGEAKRRIPVWVLLFVLAIVILEAISMVRFPKAFSDYKKYSMAESKMEDGETAQALKDLYEISEAHPQAMSVHIEAIDMAMENGYYDMAAYIYNTYLMDNELYEEDYDRIDSYYTRLEEYYTTYDAIEKINEEFSDTATEEEYIQGISESLNALLDQEGQYEANIYYYQGMLAADLQTVTEYWQKCYDADPECYDIRTILADNYRRLGDFEQSKIYINEALEKEKSDAGALRSLSIITMLEGNLEEGVKLAKQAYESDPDVRYVRDHYMIALALDNKMEESETIKNEISKAGEILEEDTIQLLNGELTLEEYYVGSK